MSQNVPSRPGTSQKERSVLLDLDMITVIIISPKEKKKNPRIGNYNSQFIEKLVF